jgi:hypothetical protein
MAAARTALPRLRELLVSPYGPTDAIYLAGRPLNMGRSWWRRDPSSPARPTRPLSAS